MDDSRVDAHIVPIAEESWRLKHQQQADCSEY